MKRLILGVAALAAAAAMTAQPARAQLGGNNQITIKGGVFEPAKSPPKDVGKDWWVLGAEYALGNTNGQKVNSIEGLYYKKSDDVANFGLQSVPTRYNVFSLMFNRKMRGVGPDGVAIGNVFFYGAGLGAQFIKIKVSDANPGGEGNIDKTRTVAAGQIFLGYELASNLQIEAKYLLPFSKVQGREMSGVQFLVGVRF